MIAKKRRMMRNRVMCGSCLAVIESRYEAEQVVCYCGDVALDGGLSYQHLVLAQGATWQDYSEYEFVEVGDGDR